MALGDAEHNAIAYAAQGECSRAQEGAVESHGEIGAAQRRHQAEQSTQVNTGNRADNCAAKAKPTDPS
jgi:hypothetical protein